MATAKKSAAGTSSAMTSSATTTKAGAAKAAAARSSAPSSSAKALKSTGTAAVAAKAASAKAAPAKAASAKAASAKAASAKAAPAKAASAKAAPAKAAPAKAAPAKAAKSTGTAAVAAKTASAKAAPATTARAKRIAATGGASNHSVPAAAEVAAPSLDRKPMPAKKVPTPPTPVLAIPPVKGVTKEGIAFTKDFDAKFLAAQRALLLSEREALTGQAVRLEDEANAMIEDGEMGDVQFDDEGGEGDTMVVERERDLALSAQARQIIGDVDLALERLTLGTYGYSTESGRPIPRERLEAIPWAVMLVEEKVGGIGRR